MTCECLLGSILVTYLFDCMRTQSQVPHAIFNFKPYILWLTPIESKATNLQYFFISCCLLFKTKDP